MRGPGRVIQDETSPERPGALEGAFRRHLADVSWAWVHLGKGQTPLLSDSAWTVAFLGLRDAVGSTLSSRKLTSGPSGDSNVRVTAAQLWIFVAESVFKEKRGLRIFGGIVSTFKY